MPPSHGGFFMVNGSAAVTKIRGVFRSTDKALTLREIRTHLPELKAQQISSTLCYLLRQRYVIREQIENSAVKERKKVWSYTYKEERYIGTDSEINPA